MGASSKTAGAATGHTSKAAGSTLTGVSKSAAAAWETMPGALDERLAG